MILSDRDIKKALEEGRISVNPLLPGSIQPASIDLHLDKKFLIFKNAQAICIDVKQSVRDLMEEVIIDEDHPFILHPGEFALGTTVEETGVGNDIVGRLEGKSSLGRIGIIIHATAGYLDPGNKLHMTLELHNIGKLPVKLYYRMAIAQMSYSPLSTPAEHPYGSGKLNSKYYGDKDPRESLYYKNFTKPAIDES